MIVMVPTRGRRAQCERLLESFTETATVADITFITDPDDQDTYEGMDWGDALHAVLDPRGTLTEKLNHAADGLKDTYGVLFWAGDDHVFRTPGWDQILLKALEEMGGTGVVYPDDKRRADIPEIWAATSDIVDTLGWFANPAVNHYYIDNSWAEIGLRTGLVRYVPDAVVEHLHYSVHAETVHDGLYQETEDAHGQRDLEAFTMWRAVQMPNDVAVLRRRFDPDVRWVLDRLTPA
jgi:hypothetical protein